MPKGKLEQLAIPLSREFQLEAFIPVDQAARLQGVSPETFRDQNPDKIVNLSPRRQGVRLKHALKLA